MGDALTARTANQPLLSGRALRILKDERLAAMVATGGDDAFATLYQRHHQSIYRYCRSLVREDSDARDALQNTMLAALASLRARPIEGAFKPWLFRIAHNESISIIRRRAREAPSEAPSAMAVSDDPETRELLRVVVSDLNALPDRQRGAIVMRELSGLSYAEIGAALGTSAAAGKQLVYEARTAMHELREGHEMSCGLVRERISARDKRLLRGRKVRAHLRGCQPCRDFEQAIQRRRTAFALLAPPLSPLIAAAVLRDVFAGGGTGAGAGGAGGAAAGVSGVASGGVPAVAGPVALKAAAAVLLTGAAGVGAIEAGTALFSGSATAPAAVTRDSTAAGSADGHHARASSEHVTRAGPGRDHGGGAPGPETARDRGQPSAGEDAGAAGDPGKADDPSSAGSAGPQDPAGAGGSNSAGSGSSDAAGTGSAGGGSGGGATGGGGSTGGGSPEGSSGAGGSDGGSGGGDVGGGDPGGGDPGGGDPGGGDPGGGDPGGGDPGGGDPGGGDPGGGTVEPPPPPPEPPAGVPPGHGGTPPGHGGVPPGQVDGGEPPGHRGGS
jgi:RNA polymerase sigma factor (sigma-70 family)